MKNIKNYQSKSNVRFMIYTYSLLIFGMISGVLLGIIICQSKIYFDIVKASNTYVVENINEYSEVHDIGENGKLVYVLTDTTETTACEWTPNEEDVIALAKTIYGESECVKSKTQQAAVAWCVLNRLDNGNYGDSVLSIVSAPNQFSGYKKSNPVYDEYRELAIDVLTRWYNEKNGEENVGRVLPSDYYFFIGDGKLNYFTNTWKSKNYWNWSLETPYES